MIKKPRYAIKDSHIEFAKRILVASPSQPEDNIRQDIGRLLDALEIENRITFVTDDGPADLYLPRRRTIFETKSVGLADNPDKPQGGERRESPYSQLQRYIQSEINKELGILESSSQSDRPWVGVLTDGKVWHAWYFPHKKNTTRQEIFRGFRPQNAMELLSKLRQIVSIDPIGKPWIPEDPMAIFEDRLRTLQHEVMVNLSGTSLVETQTKKTLWLDMLRTASMAPENTDRQSLLFLSHSLLIAIARGVVHTLSNPNLAPDPVELLKEGFASWILTSNRGITWAQELLEAVNGYEWRRTAGDVLRILYQGIIAESDRKVFGEYYTPDWLASLLVEQVLDEEWCNKVAAAALAVTHGQGPLEKKGMLDPSCGSGTFLYHAAKKILRCEALSEARLSPIRKADAVARIIIGIDIHPVAVEISRATLMRALPAIPSDGEDAIQVFQGDSLMAYENDGNNERIFTHSSTNFRLATPGGNEIYIPRSLACQENFPSTFARIVECAKEGHMIPRDILMSIPEMDRKSLSQCRDQLFKTIEREGNSIWTWYVTNITAPLRVSERKVDRIVANPPWVKLSDVQDAKRKVSLESLFQKIGLWNGSKQAPHHDIAQLFLKHCRYLYMATPDKNPAGWLVKKTMVRGDHWKKARDWWEMKVGKQQLDLELVKPFGGGDSRKCVALLDHCKCHRGIETAGKRLVFKFRDSPSGKGPRNRIRAMHHWGDAIREMKVLIAEEPIPQRPSEYEIGLGFHQGATVVPSVLVLVNRERSNLAGNPAIVCTVQSKQRKWKGIEPQRGSVPLRWIQPIIRSQQLMPFALLDPAYAVIPMREDGTLESDPSNNSDYWQHCEDLYSEYRTTGSNNPATLMRRINYNNGLKRQLSIPSSKHKCMILYPRSADIMRAARGTPNGGVVDSSLYYWIASSVKEAMYLIAILNASSLTKAFAQSRQSGRDFHLYPWRKIPIPRFSNRDPIHVKIANVGFRAEKKVRSLISCSSIEFGQVALSKRIREHLAKCGITEDLNELVRNVLPDQAT